MTRHATPADYARLGLPQSATTAEVKSAFRKQALLLHPDLNPDDPEAGRRFREIAASYEACLLGPAPRPNTIPGRAAAARHEGGKDAGMGDMHGAPVAPAYSPTQHRAKRAAAAASADSRPLAALEVGDIVWADYAAILVAADRNCYLDPSAAGRVHVDRGTQVRVERGPDGYQVTLPANCRYRWSVSPRAAAIGLAVVFLAFGDREEPPHAGNARIPGRLVDSTVAKMMDGQRGWTVASALVVVPGGRILIDGEEQIAPTPTLTTPVRVEKRADGWHVTAPGNPQQWVDQGRTPSHRHVEVTSALLGGVSVGPMNRVRQ